MTKSTWYHSTDDITVGDVYYEMDDSKKFMVKVLLDHAAKRTFPTQPNKLAEQFDKFTENEKLATYYLLNEAVLRKNNLSDILNLWVKYRKVEFNA